MKDHREMLTVRKVYKINILPSFFFKNFYFILACQYDLHILYIVYISIW